MIPATWIVLGFLVAVLLYLLPSEQVLGANIKAVFLHGAVARTGLIVFAATGLMGLAAMVWKTNEVDRWCMAVLKTAVIFWVAYEITGMISSYLAWGVAIAWDEPQVRAGLWVLGASVVLIAVVLWVKDRWFTAGASVILGVFAWVTMKTAPRVRHPVNPIGESGSDMFKVLYFGLLVLVILMAVQTVRWMRGKE